MLDEGTGRGTGCLAENTLEALSRGGLSAEEQAAAALHLDVCEDCRRVLAALGRAASLPAVQGDTEPELAARFDRPRAQQSLPAGTPIGRYTVLHAVGAGAMGTVYAAYDPELDRRVALKLVHHRLFSEESREGAAIRLLREAQALARLSHPNVITVFDAGRLDEQVFLAMEFVEGGTLRQWVHAAPRSPAEIVAHFLAAGRGLAALHAAGLVHRDFKPENVLVSADGRVRVSDFGLARVASAAAPTSEGRLDAGRPLPAGDEVLTRTGTLLGTPAYMAPEVWQGAPADARSDQFAFCVALCEALQGERPFAAAEMAEGTGALALRPTLRPERVPAALRGPLTVGLARAPDQRHPSMHALLAALERGMSSGQRRRRAFAAAFAAAALGAVGLGAWARQRADEQRRAGDLAACAAVGASIDAVWGETGRSALERAFLATGSPSAATTFEKTAPWLDRWAESWRAAAEGACRAHTVDATWDAELHARAEECLGDAREDFAALVRALGEADGVARIHATAAAAELAPVEPCTDPAALRERPGLPAAQREVVREIRGRLARARSLQAVGEFQAAQAVAREATRAAADAGWPVIVAEAEYRAASLETALGDYAAAEAGLLRALAAAERAGSRGLALTSTTDLVYVVGHHAARHAEGRVWARAAQTQLALVPGAQPLEQAALDNHLAAVLDGAGDYAGAARLHARALALREEALGPSHPEVARSLVGLAAARQAQGELAEAAELYAHALATQERVFGPDHPDVALVLHNLAGVRRMEGAPDDAVRLYERALALEERALGPDHPSVAETLHDLAGAHRARGAHAESLRLHTRALQIYERALGPDHPRVASSLNDMGVVHQAIGDVDGARRLYERALAVYERALGPGHLDVGATLYNLALLRREAGALAEATQLFTRALAIYEASLGAEHPDVAEIVHEIAATRPR